MFDGLVLDELFPIVLVFTRVGAAMMLLPGFGEVYVTPRARLLIALTISLIITPLVAPTLPPLPGNAWALGLLVLAEVVIGLFFGTIARLFISAMQIAGMVIAYQSAMANALTNDPTAAQQAATTGAFMATTAVVLLFVTDLHHMLIEVVVASYDVFQPGAMPPFGDMSELVSRVVAKSFLIGVQIAAPFVVIGFLFFLGLGLLARLMPQVQVFFIAMPAQVGLGLIVLALTMSAGLLWFLKNFQDAFLGFGLIR